ncbi:protein disulfide oxidoreductase [Ornatilinea apprima]|nr:thioredoxin family protein [Ornatilinea apprima]
MEKMLNQDIRKQIKDLFADLKAPVAVLFFGSKVQSCDYCKETVQLLEEVSELSDLIELKQYDLEENAELAKQFSVDKAPVVVLAGKNGDEIVDYGVRFAGIPAGHEFTSLIQGLLMVANSDSGLDDKTKAMLAKVTEPLHFYVFVTPTCPYCPQAVILAHRMAFENPLVQAEMVEAMEFPELSNQFGVSGVPHTVINFGADEVVGAVPEAHMRERLTKLMQSA